MPEAPANLLDLLIVIPEWVIGQLATVIAYPLSSATRIYVLYLASSLLFAMFIYNRSREGSTATSLREFLFPAEVWRNPSAWLDVRYFFFHQVFRLVIYGGFLGGITLFVFDLAAPAGSTMTPAGTDWLIALLFGILVTLVTDFVAYVVHYLQHRVPLLWEFHKVHHSATVMHPLTNYREHPVDNLFYAAATGCALGLTLAGVATIVGYVPEAPTILGTSFLVFMYNFLGYNLRHSHIWLRWPGKLSMIFGSPAHHQIHHSYHPEHIDRNFAFMFPIWDVIFGTYCLPETNKDVRFGLGENREPEYTTVLGMYFVPVKNALLSITGKRPLQTS